MVRALCDEARAAERAVGEPALPPGNLRSARPSGFFHIHLASTLDIPTEIRDKADCQICPNPAISLPHRDIGEERDATAGIG